MNAPNILHAKAPGEPIPVRVPQPLSMAETGTLKLLDELTMAAQWQLIGPSPAFRQAWRQRMNECHAELRQRIMKGEN